MFRIHIDIPLGSLTEEDSIEVAEEIGRIVQRSVREAKQSNLIRLETDTFSIRLGHDEDRQKSNYLRKTDAGHVTTKKTKKEI